MINNSVNRYTDNSIDRKPPSNEELKRQGITTDTQITEALNNWSYNQASVASLNNTITSDKLIVNTNNTNSANFPPVSVDLSNRASNPNTTNRFRLPTNDELRRQGYITENQMTEALNNWSAESSRQQVQNNTQYTAIPIQQPVSQTSQINNLARQGMSDLDQALLDNPSLRSLGRSLRVSNYNDPVVQRNISDLALMPEHVLKRLADSRIDRIQFGSGGVPDFEGNEHYRNVNPRHEEGGRTFNTVAGIYDPNNRRVTIGSVNHGSISVSLHEVSHAIGGRFNLDTNREMKRIHENLFSGQPQDGILNKNFLSPYLRGPNPGSEAGMQETFAEALATYIKLGEKIAVERYGTELINYLKRNVIEEK